ncbi:MAG: glycosyltransferase family 1 protein [Sandaracinaceae bacterium]|nr:glycosyltransferase family 1 protein [Sandaracinaceae bacterium]
MLARLVDGDGAPTMKITVLTHGTRGDVQPFVALALALRPRGHEVTLGVPINLVDFVKAAGVRCSPLAMNSQTVMESEQGQEWLASGNVRAFFKALGDIITAGKEELNASSIAACEGAEAIIGNMLMDDIGSAIAEARGVPFIAAYSMPIFATGAYPSPFVTTAQIPTRFLRRFSHGLFASESWKSRTAWIRDLRAQLGLDPVDRCFVARADALGTPVLHMWSEHLLAKADDWGDQHVLTGSWELPSSARGSIGEGTAPPGLSEWLSSGPTPFFLGFGSMPIRDPKAMLRMVHEVTDELGVRAVIGAGWSGLDQADADRAASVFMVRAVDHSWLFPQCVGVVHHGGAGTTAAAATAGVPALVCSVFADQPFWGERVKRLGVGDHVPFRKLDKRRLRDGLALLQRPDVRARAAQLGERMRTDDGLAAAVRAVEERLGSPAVKVAQARA